MTRTKSNDAANSFTIFLGKEMYKPPPSIEATPILADQTDVLDQQPIQNDVPRAFQDLKKAPVKLLYAKTCLLYTSPSPRD